MAVQQKFDFGQADALKSKLKSEISKIESDLKNMAKQVEGVKSWWSGGSEDAFIGNFNTTKDQVVKSLNIWVEDYQKLIESIKQNKIESEQYLANQLKM